MAGMSSNEHAPDPHAAYRLDVQNVEEKAVMTALIQHHQSRAYALHLEVRARDARIAELEAHVARLEQEAAAPVDDAWEDAPAPPHVMGSQVTDHEGDRWMMAENGQWHISERNGEVVPLTGAVLFHNWPELVDLFGPLYDDSGTVWS